MASAVLDQLGQLIIQKVRDVTIMNFESYADGKSLGNYGKEMHTLFSAQTIETQAFVRQIVPHIVDEALIIFLQTLDWKVDQMQLAINLNEQYRSVYEFTESLGSEYEMNGGWRDRFSQK